MLLLFALFLSACSQDTNDLSDSWQSLANEKGFSLEATEGLTQIIFTVEGMYATTNPQQWEATEREKPFPFEEEVFYKNYEVEQLGDKLIIKTDEGLEYTLTIDGERIYTDEENEVEYHTDEYLL